MRFRVINGITKVKWLFLKIHGGVRRNRLGAGNNCHLGESDKKIT